MITKRIYIILASAGIVATVFGTVCNAYAQGTVIGVLEVDGTCASTRFVNGIHYTAGTTTVKEFYDVTNLTTAGQGYAAGTGYEIITTPTGTITTSLNPIGFSIGNSSTTNGNDATLSMASDGSPYSMGFIMDVLGVTLAPTIASFQAFCNAFNAEGAIYPIGDFAWTSDNGPDFSINAMTMTVPEPTNAAITASIALSGNSLNLSWNTVAGQTYQPQFRTNMILVILS